MNIKEMLQVIISEGVKGKSLCNKLGVTSATISRTLNGKTSPKYQLGKAIENLYKEVIAENKKAG